MPTVSPKDRIVPPSGFVPPHLAPAALAAAPLKVPYLGGPVIGSVEVVPVYWGAAWSSADNAKLTTELDAFFDFIVTSSYMDLLREYSTGATTINHGKRLASARVSATEPGTVTPDGREISETQIQTAIQGWINDTTVPASNANTLYFVFLPPNVTALLSNLRSCIDFCGYHGNLGSLYYAVVPYANCNGCVFSGDFIDTLTEVASHELAEAITDPESNGWRHPTESEIGDICNRQTVKLGNFVVQSEWSNVQNACVFAPPASPFSIAFQADDGDLSFTNNKLQTAIDTNLGMMDGTSPAIAPSGSGRHSIVFQANTGNLWVSDGGFQNGADTLLGMKDGTSPSIAVMRNKKVKIAFQANTGNLWVTDGTPQTGVDTELGMMAGTSPCIAALPNGKVVIAFQANTGNLWVTDGRSQSGTDMMLGMMPGTSPCVAVFSNGTFIIAFQASTGNLWINTGKPQSGVDTLLGMMPATSPSITVLQNGRPRIAFQANTGILWTSDGNVQGGFETQLGMANGTSPSIASFSNGHYSIAFQANTGNLWHLTVDGSGQGGVDTLFRMKPKTSPWIDVVN